MRLIAHRGNVNGPDRSAENSLDYIDTAIGLAYDVEVDLRRKSGEFYLGHDGPEHHVLMEWLVERKNNLWIHCKDFASLEFLSECDVDFNYFWHDTDDHTLTSKGYIWSYPGQPHSSNSIVVLPENIETFNFSDCDYDCYGICSDYVGRIL